MYTTVHTLQEPTTDIILEILKEPIQNEQNEQDPEFKMKTAYRQCVDLERLDKDGMNFVSAEETVFLSVTTDFIFLQIRPYSFISHINQKLSNNSMCVMHIESRLAMNCF